MSIATAVKGPRSGMDFVTTPPMIPALAPADRGRALLLFYFIRLQLPDVRFSEPRYLAHLERSYRIFLPKNPAPVSWSAFLEGLYAVDWAVCIGCLEGQNAAWEVLFNARTGRSDCLLVDALRARAVRLYPRNEERQETAITEFWSNLIAPESEGALPVLARYDGHRPLAPWLIRVFQNWHLSKLRGAVGVSALPDEDVLVPMEPVATNDPIGRWHEVFVQAARDWLGSIDDEERLLLGLRWRYRLSQREAAKLFGLNEGTLTRRTDKLRDRALEQIGERLVAEGWSGDDLNSFVRTELGAILTDDPRLSADHLGRLLAAKGKTLADAGS
jgi:DNA-directed RNA polymerase specialized sigma24 family protein